MVVGLVLAAASGLPRRRFWVSAGIGTGLAGAVVVAAFAGTIASSVAGMGQEIFNAAVLFAAVLMLGWHNVWMARHGAALASEIKAVGRDVLTGVRPQHVLATIVGVAVLREGSETVLFLYGIAISQQEAAFAMWSGALLGLAVGVAMGYLLYIGLMRLTARRLFAVTGWLIALLAAGMAAQGAGFLTQADLLPPLADPLWDTSGVLSQQSALGRILQVLIGYLERPSGMQAAFYLATLGAIVILSRLYGAAPPRAAASARALGDIKVADQGGMK